MFEYEGPKFRLVMDRLKEQMADGRIQPGDRMPTIRALATTYGVSHATATRAMREMCREGYAYVDGNATYARDRGQAQVTFRVPVSTAKLPGSGGLALLPGWTEVTEAGIVTAPDYVCDVMGIQRDSPVLRRELVDRHARTRDGDQPVEAMPRPVRLYVLWHPAEFADLIPELLLTGPVDAQSPRRIGEVGSRLVEEMTGRTPRAGLDSFHGRNADEREARLLGIAEGDAILARVATREDEQGITEYMESCFPVGVVVSFEFRDPFDTDEE